jgi:hypothetical protein
MGGGAVVAAGKSNRATVDLDLAAPKPSPKLQEAAVQVAKTFGLSPDWLNAAGAIFAKQLPKGWEDRGQIFFNKPHLKVYHLHLDDLFLTKCLAYFDRLKTTDLQDLQHIAPSPRQLTQAEAWLLAIKEPEESATAIHDYFIKLKKELKGEK